MMIKETVQKLLNEQINAEYYSAYLYLGMSAYCSHAGFHGFANWMNAQAREELAHGTHLFEHLLERDAAPRLTEIKAPLQSFDSLKEIFEQSLKHEKYITEKINKIASLAMQEGDHATYQFILWYVEEQIEEESSVSDILQKITLIGDNLPMLFALDSQLAARTFMNPFAVAQRSDSDMKEGKHNEV